MTHLFGTTGYSQVSNIHNVVDILETTSGTYNLDGATFNSTVIRYYLNGDTVLRNDNPLMDFSFFKRPGKNDLFPYSDRPIVTKIPTQHLIDLRRNITSTFFRSDDTLYIEFDSLRNNGFELIYNYPVNYKYTFKEVGRVNKRKVIVFDRKCFRGYAISTKGDTVFFYYTKKSVPFSSPLNRFIPAFPYPILRIGLPATGSANTFYLNYTIVAMRQIELDESVFHLPPSGITSWPLRVTYPK